MRGQRQQSSIFHLREERVVSFVQKGLLIKSILLSVLVFGIVFSHPAVNLLQVGAHQVCR